MTLPELRSLFYLLLLDEKVSLEDVLIVWRAIKKREIEDVLGVDKPS